jgi:hypothetical protein
VQAAELGDQVLPRAQVQVVRVAEQHRRAERAQFVGWTPFTVPFVRPA